MPTDRRQTLGQFLRTQREKLSPSQAGLLVVPHRRRTPGLRREEAAQLCGISTTWYTWLEQGRDVTCSPASLSRIATALQMSTTERRYLFTLAELRDPHQITPSVATPNALLNLPKQIKSPTYLLDPLWNVLSANDPAKDLFTGWMDSPEPNQLRYVFLNPEAKTFLTNWPDRSRRLLAEFRADTAHLARTTAFQALTSALQAESQEFLHFWQDQRVLPREGGQRSFKHPVRGVLNYEQITLTPAEHTGYKLVILTPTSIEQTSAS